MLFQLALTILDLTRRPFWTRLNKPYAPWPRVLLSSIFTLLWIGAIPSSIYNCDGLCSAAQFRRGFIIYASLCCDCSGPTLADCGLVAARLEGATVGREQRSYRYEVAQALDALMV